MKTFIGSLLILFGILGAIFFSRYTGNTIPSPILWYLAFILMVLLGARLILTSFKRTQHILDQAVAHEFVAFKSTAEKVDLDFDKCEFKSGTYSHQVDDPNLSPFKLLSSSPLSSFASKNTETLVQSYLIYTCTIKGAVYKFVSQSFPFDPTTLKYYVINSKVTLYFDPLKPEKYLFDLLK